jgi:hypothetical protein
MAFIDSRPFRLVFAAAFGLAVFAVCITGWWASTYLLAIRDVKSAVGKQLADATSVSFEQVTFNKATRIGCGSVNVAKSGVGKVERSQFILFADGTLELSPPELKEGDPTLQIAALEKQSAYAKLIVKNCLS